MKAVARTKTESLSRIGEKAAGLFFAGGLFFLLNALCLGQEDLEKPMIPIHLALMGYSGACMYSAIGSKVSSLELLAVVILGGLLSLASGQTWVLAAGWVVLIAWSTLVAYRGGRK